MELKEPKRKRKCNSELQQSFPIFIESEIGIPLENWVPIVCTGIFNGYGVVVNAPAEMCALFNMGNFGKGSNSRSRPYVMRSNPKIPQFIRKRQFIQRKKFSSRNQHALKELDDSHRVSASNDLQTEIKKLHAAIENSVVKINLRENKEIDEPRSTVKPNVIDILSSDEEIGQVNAGSMANNSVLQDSGNMANDLGHLKQTSIENVLEIDKHTEHIESIGALTFPDNSVMVLPDSDSQNEDYFNKLKSKLFIDESGLKENLILTLNEAYFLAYGLGCLQILDEEKKPLDLDSSWSLFCSVQNDFSMKYIVYHYFRSKGWIVKPGIKFGGDFLLYKEGQPFYHASYIVLIEAIDSSQSFPIKSKFDWTSALGIIRMAGTAVKEILIAQVYIPADIAQSELHKKPDYIEKISVQEVLLRRWLPKLERMDSSECP